ncbi:hypothetical protein KZZ52_21190 [Dactylosporangium sp. AC04546]|uniref:hypothetical protein n=1 Tax=Dactylosporangium sp. AC04546 TaxID=2862460 RepID=UPI001EE01E5F|nr:hypothetical protein [Dactylosporangium sp. AC04546]WVK87802.1 hypothetical protein KZZ52_21190 [Dactylosporangium sp. AC04546]
MNWSKGIRQFHRWTSIAFTLSVVLVTAVVVVQEEPAIWLTLTPLLPLGLLLGTGLYMFALPYVRRRRAALEG